MKNESYLVNKSRCPQCAKLGNDKRGDNLVNYSDGHCFCFACGYLQYNDDIRIQNIAQRNSFLSKETVSNQATVKLPEDISIDYPKETIQWITQYDLTIDDLIKHNALWSDSVARLFFPIFSEHGCIFYNARYFGQDKTKPKWLARGNKPLHHLPGKQSIILVEDIISAIKINKLNYGSICLFGTAFLNKLPTLKQLTSGYKSILLWLDPDKFRESIRMVRWGVGQGLDIRLLQSEKDPKEHSFSYLKTKIG